MQLLVGVVAMALALLAMCEPAVGLMVVSRHSRSCGPSCSAFPTATFDESTAPAAGHELSSGSAYLTSRGMISITRIGRLESYRNAYYGNNAAGPLLGSSSLQIVAPNARFETFGSKSGVLIAFLHPVTSVCIKIKYTSGSFELDALSTSGRRFSTTFENYWDLDTINLISSDDPSYPFTELSIVKTTADGWNIDNITVCGPAPRLISSPTTVPPAQRTDSETGAPIMLRIALISVGVFCACVIGISMLIYVQRSKSTSVSPISTSHAPQTSASGSAQEPSDVSDSVTCSAVVSSDPSDSTQTQSVSSGDLYGDDLYTDDVDVAHI